ncbi:MAG: alpha/beta hydrolase [Proteobacteria bacterium]|nr:alpha/beta hydrolase [Pseudomonadota bacterium]HQR04866.1 alpha/beta hydrolase [Rhodocyclaceae bacterium]
MADITVSLDADGTLNLGPRRIPVPAHLSPEARQYLAMPRMGLPAHPPLADKAAWRQYIAERNAAMHPYTERMLTQAGDRATVTTETLSGVVVHIARPRVMPEHHRGRLHVSVHGGGLVYLAGDYARAEAAVNAAQFQCETWSVDYRVPPDHPYPAAVDDVIAAWRHALAAGFAPGRAFFSGSSAGGCLAPAALLKARDQGLPLPGAVVLLTPECDLTESGDSFHTLREVDNVLPRPLPAEIALYANGADLRHPYLSPLFGDFGAGFPPTLIQSGTRDLFLSNSVRMHRALRRAGVPAQLHVWEAAPHGGFPGAPEAGEVREEILHFLQHHLR